MRPDIWPDRDPIPFQLTDRGRGAVEPEDLIWSGPTRSAEEAALWLARDGGSLDHARAQVRAYQDDVSARLGMSVHDWGIDDVDLDAIEAEVEGHVVHVPPPRSAPDNEQRRAELTSWHAADESAVSDGGLDRGPM